MYMPLLIAQRAAIGAATLLLVSLLVFIGTEILPGDVATAILGQGATPELVSALHVRLHLDDPAYVRYLHWLGNLLVGDAGQSLVNRLDVAETAFARAQNSLILTCSTAAVAVPLSLLLGLIAASRPNGKVDRAISAFSVFMISIPDFLLAILLVTLFAVKLGWLPSIARIRSSYDLLDWLRVLVLPVTTLTFAVLPHMARMTRTAVLEVLETPALEMATLKGLPRWRVLTVHALPNALGPIANVIALNLAYLISGVVVIETLFNFPGLGRYMVDAVTIRDVPAVQICAMLFCGAYILLNLAADIIAIVANPRVRYPR
jgi:peptide/nickel transport system permease protein